MLEVHQFPCLSDNYGFLLHDHDSEETVCIDTPDADEYLRQAGKKGWQITQIWNTHWHPDHAGGNETIKRVTNCSVTGPKAEADKIAGIDRMVGQGDVIRIGDRKACVIDVGGHTLGHVAYHLPGARMAFVGDSVFALGCGRMFEGTPEQFWTSLKRVKALPAETMLYCAHEYTAANAKFAAHADPDNAELAGYVEEILKHRANDQPTVPMKLERELATNPFLRADNPRMQARWGGGDAVATFAALRRAKDDFRG